MTLEELQGWVSGRVAPDWFETAPSVTVDRDEILIVGRIALPTVAEDASDAARAAAVQGRIREFRERSREARMEVARELEHRVGRKVAWGVECGEARQLFTTLAAPVMTRLRQPERQVLDTLVEAGVARSRSDALVWCVRLVGEHSEEWLGRLREAMSEVDRIRREGPVAG